MVSRVEVPLGDRGQSVGGQDLLKTEQRRGKQGSVVVYNGGGSVRGWGSR